MYELRDYRFQIQFRGGYKNDVWALYGISSATGQGVYVSTPVKLEGDVLTTYSGSKYRLVESYNGDDETIKNEIREVIERGSYTYH